MNYILKNKLHSYKTMKIQGELHQTELLFLCYKSEHANWFNSYHLRPLLLIDSWYKSWHLLLYYSSQYVKEWE
jgi:hypothetical protein